MDQWLDNVNQECIQMRHLVESLLMLARSDLTRPDIAGWERVNFSDLVMEESLTFEPVFYQLGKELDEEVEEDLWVTGSPRELRQVVKILLDNAAKYSREKGLTWVLLKSVGRKQVKLGVISEGNVIPREQRKAVFRRFYRGDASRSSNDSYGLGLALARAIAKNHRGTIRLEADGESNHFTIKIRRQTGGMDSRLPDAPR